jgi:DNA-binding XRE family transcriptional regulator
MVVIYYKYKHYRLVVLNIEREESMKTDKKFKALMQGLRQQAGLSQKELAEKAGVSGLTYQRYEYGDRVPDARTATRIAKALGATVEELWGSSLTA